MSVTGLPAGSTIAVEPDENGLLVLRAYVSAEHYTEMSIDLAFAGGATGARARVLLALDAHRLHRSQTPIAREAAEAGRRMREHIAAAPEADVDASEARQKVRARVKGTAR